MSEKPTTKRVAANKLTPKKTNSSKVSFSVSDYGPEKVTNNTGYIADSIGEVLNTRQKINQINDSLLKKSVQPQTVRRDVRGNYDKTKVTFSAKSYQSGFDGVETKGYRRLDDNELREVATVDPYISSIISTRCSQGAVVARPSDSKFDKGTRILDLDPPSLEDYFNEKQYKSAKEKRTKQSKVILDWVWNCGTRDEDIINEVYSDPRSDQTFKKCTFADFLNAQIRNLLTFGRCATHVIRDEDGLPVMFRPVPVETIYNVRDKDDAHLTLGEDTFDESVEDAHDYNAIPEEYRPYAYIQKVDGRNVNFFTEDELRIDYFQKQALFDLRGYPLSPIEMAIYMVFIHQNTLNYLRNQFVKGLGTKGALVLESTEIAAELSPEDLEVLRREFHNFLNRNDNSAVTPVISGPVKVEWIPFSSNPRDMEYLQVEEHVIRALCAAFQTSPQEMGYGHLSINQGGLTQSDKQEDIVRGEERGLRMLLDIVYDCVNDIFYENFEEGRDNFRITYTGVGEDTRDAVIERHNQELNTTATLGSLWADSEKNEPIPAGANVPLSPAFHSNVVKYMKYGFFMEKFFGFEGWADKPEYDFIIDANLNQAYMQRLGMDNAMMKEQGELQLESLEAQTQEMEAQAQATGAQMDQMQQQQEMAQQQQEAEGVDDQAQDMMQAQPGQVTPAQKSLLEEFESRDQLMKSYNSYFKAWMNAHDHVDENDL